MKENDANGTLDPEEHYDAMGDREWPRLESGFTQGLEYAGTRTYLKQNLPNDGHILDAGGGAGRYAIWLVMQGYRVMVLDISTTQVELAREKAVEHGVNHAITTMKGDIRELDFNAQTFDATLCLGGAVSHLVTANERERAVYELQRVTKPGQPIFISVVGRLHVLQLLAGQLGGFPDDLDQSPVLPNLASAGTYDQALLDTYDCRPVLRNNHFFRVNELETLLEETGLQVQKIIGLENIASLLASGKELDTEQKKAIEKTVSQLREDRGAADLSAHILAVTLRPRR